LCIVNLRLQAYSSKLHIVNHGSIVLLYNLFLSAVSVGFDLTLIKIE